MTSYNHSPKKWPVEVEQSELKQLEQWTNPYTVEIDRVRLVDMFDELDKMLVVE